MGLGNIIYCLLVIATKSLTCSVENGRPNIVFIIADDLGWNDVSFHGSNQIPTPNIDTLAMSGVAFGRYYSHAMCTPTRSALLTGKYSHKIGMQGYPLSMSEDRGIPFQEKLLPQYLKEAGYVTHLTGKWHVGASRNAFLPTARGFNSHFGLRGGYMDYNEYTVEETYDPVGTVSGICFFKNSTPAWDVNGYITDVYTEHATSIIKNHDTSAPLFLMLAHNAPHCATDGAPLQAPAADVRKMRHIELTPRRIFGAMVKKLDDSVGEIVKALNEKGILHNTIITFVSDNGAMTTGNLANFGSNFPFRGIKLTPWEGGIRVAGLIWSECLKNSEHFYDGFMHVADWLPTLLTAAGVKVPMGIDGINQWDSINFNMPSNRTVLYEIDDLAGYASMIHGNFKIVTGNVDEDISDYEGEELRKTIGSEPSYTEAIFNSDTYNVLRSRGYPFTMSDFNLREKTTIECRNSNSAERCQPSHNKICLYNIIEDPCETTDVSHDLPDLVEEMKKLLKKEYDQRIPRHSTFRDPLAAPRPVNNYAWDTWVPDSAPITS